MNILIVDDELPAVQGILQIMDWKRLGIENAYVAYSLREAMEQFSQHYIELLLTDIEMQGGTGFDLIRWCNARNMRYVSISTMRSAPSRWVCLNTCSNRSITACWKALCSALLPACVSKMKSRSSGRTQMRNR